MNVSLVPISSYPTLIANILTPPTNISLAKPGGSVKVKDNSATFIVLSITEVSGTI